MIIKTGRAEKQKQSFEPSIRARELSPRCLHKY
ncbi:Beta-transducin like protein [Giardia duodenalis assemblage B]|uniref:Beta-transducin like protein n=1 Tax=Giardia duodenalis assemblage B TaxID=1394984 RepID=A0A132NMC8_GIAIN|nr:Beta-transducin like protein [Giardia intestinalis assemblage B]